MFNLVGTVETLGWVGDHKEKSRQVQESLRHAEAEAGTGWRGDGVGQDTRARGTGTCPLLWTPLARQTVFS